MSAIVCGKRSFFEELRPTSPPASSKRLRCSSSPVRLSPPRPHQFSSPSPLDHLVSLFPDMDKQFIEQALEACGNDLDSAIRSLNELSLGSSGRNIYSIDVREDTGTGRTDSLLSGGDVSGACDDTPAAVNQFPMDGSEWVELFVKEMLNASDVNDARSRASRVLHVLEESIMSRAGVEAPQNLHKENVILKEQVEVLLRDNAILKRAVAIQHERQKEYDEKNEETQHLKQLVSQYQEQLRTLEVNNYALTMHLKQAQQNNSMPGHFHPDVF